MSNDLKLLFQSIEQLDNDLKVRANVLVVNGSPLPPSTLVRITPDILEEIQDAMYARAIDGSVGLCEEIEKFEKLNGLEYSNLPLVFLSNFLFGHEKFLYRIQCERIGAVILSIPSRNMLDLTETNYAKIDEKIRNTGYRYIPPNRIMKRMAEYEAVNELASCALTGERISGLLDGSVQQIAEDDFLRFMETLDYIRKNPKPISIPDRRPATPPQPLGAQRITNWQTAIEPGTLQSFSRTAGSLSPSALVTVADPNPATTPSRFAEFTAPVFVENDAAGDSMLSLLTNAERALQHNDHIGLIGNVRKFVEMFLHHTLLSLKQDYLESLKLPSGQFNSILRTTREYREQSIAVAQASSGESENSIHRARIEMFTLTRSFRYVMNILSRERSAEFPAGLENSMSQILDAGSNVHIQLNKRTDPDDSQVLEHAHDLAKWFNERFCKDSSRQDLPISNEQETGGGLVTEVQDANAHINTVTSKTMPDPDASKKIFQAFEQGIDAAARYILTALAAGDSSNTTATGDMTAAMFTALAEQLTEDVADASSRQSAGRAQTITATVRRNLATAFREHGEAIGKKVTVALTTAAGGRQMPAPVKSHFVDRIASVLAEKLIGQLPEILQIYDRASASTAVQEPNGEGARETLANTTFPDISP